MTTNALNLGNSRPLSVLCLFAHPDDEAFGSGGTLAGLVKKGHNVTMVCVTNGDVGEISDPALATSENLWEVRQGELRNFGVLSGWALWDVDPANVTPKATSSSSAKRT